MSKTTGIFICIMFFLCSASETNIVLIGNTIWFPVELKYVTDNDTNFWSTNGYVVYFAEDGFYKQMLYTYGKRTKEDSLRIDSLNSVGIFQEGNLGDDFASWDEGKWRLIGKNKIAVIYKEFYRAIKPINYKLKESILDTFSIVVSKNDKEKFYLKRHSSNVSYRIYDNLSKSWYPFVRLRWNER